MPNETYQLLRLAVKVDGISRAGGNSVLAAPCATEAAAVIVSRMKAGVDVGYHAVLKVDTGYEEGVKKGEDREMRRKVMRRHGGTKPYGVCRVLPSGVVSGRDHRVSGPSREKSSLNSPWTSGLLGVNHCKSPTAFLEFVIVCI